MSIEIAFIPSLYKELNNDLVELNGDLQLLHHYREYGYHEGRVCCDIISREGLIGTIPESSRVLEIGAFAMPITENLPYVDHFDLLDKRQLIEKAIKHRMPAHRIPFIRYVDPSGNLEVIPRHQHDVAVSCHVIGHPPCLVRHLNQVMDLLQPRGRYLLVIPDKRFVFDQPLPPTRVSEVVDAFVHQRTKHTLTSVIDEVYSTGHNDWKRHWEGDHTMEHKELQLVTEAISRFRADDSIDVHAWRFTPMSFEAILTDLTRLGYFTTSFSTKIYPTIYGSHEFFAVLQKA
ncbi:hypothetical protein NZK33_08640 [Cyanobium sp. FGCU-6]|jgi:hypothetical protein|nr:hypothetical protein [Cyanobium sp. FGCU6]